jgi:hypothetical protein
MICLSPVLDIDEDLLECLWDSGEPVWWAKTLFDTLANLLVHQCVQHEEEWKSAYVYLLLVMPSIEQRRCHFWF